MNNQPDPSPLPFSFHTCGLQFVPYEIILSIWLDFVVRQNHHHHHFPDFQVASTAGRTTSSGTKVRPSPRRTGSARRTCTSPMCSRWDDWARSLVLWSLVSWAIGKCCVQSVSYLRWVDISVVGFVWSARLHGSVLHIRVIQFRIPSGFDVLSWPTPFHRHHRQTNPSSSLRGAYASATSHRHAPIGSDLPVALSFVLWRRVRWSGPLR